MHRAALAVGLLCACGGGPAAPRGAVEPEPLELPPGAGAPAASERGGTSEPEAPSEPEPEAATADAYLHDPSGARFPDRAGPFDRGEVTVYDPDGLDVGVAYEREGDVRIAGTVYVYPQDRDPPSPIDAVKYAIEYHHPKARLLEERRVSIDLGGSTLDGRFVAYRLTDEFDARRMEILSVGYVFRRERWNLKYRFTFPATADRDAAMREIEALLEALRWK